MRPNFRIVIYWIVSTFGGTVEIISEGMRVETEVIIEIHKACQSSEKGNYPRNKLPREWLLGQPVPHSQTELTGPCGTCQPKDLTPLAYRGTKSWKHCFLTGHSRFCESFYILKEIKGEISQNQTSQASESASTPGLWLMWQLKAKRTEGSLGRISVSFSIHSPSMRRVWVAEGELEPI